MYNFGKWIWDWVKGWAVWRWLGDAWNWIKNIAKRLANAIS